MAKQLVKLIFPQELITEPIIYDMGKQFRLVTNIFRANVTQDKGWVLLQLEGKAEDINKAVSWTKEKGVAVEEVTEDLLKAPQEKKPIARSQ